MASPATTASASSVSPSVPNRRPLLAGDDVPWRASIAVPRVHHAPVLRVATEDNPAAYALAVMKHPDPVGEGLVVEAVAEAAGPECVVPGQPPPLRLLGLRVWPIDVELRFLEPFGRELHSMRKFVDKSCSVMDSYLPNKVAHRLIIISFDSEMHLHR